VYSRRAAAETKHWYLITKVRKSHADYGLHWGESQAGAQRALGVALAYEQQLSGGINDA